MGGGPYSSMNYGPRIMNPDGTTNIRCRQCTRVVARVASPVVTTVTKCGICLLVDQGWSREDAERQVLHQYYQRDITKQPIPLIDPEDEVVTLYEEEAQGDKTKKWGFLRPLFRVLGWIPEPEPEVKPVSKEVSKRKRNKGLWEQEEGQ